MQFAIKNTCLGAGALAFALFAGPAMAQDAEFDTWDADANAEVSTEEFSTGFATAGVFEAWDTDSDGVLSEAEFEAGVDGAHDFETRFGATAFEDWNTDGAEGLAEDEFVTGLYAVYDLDDDQVLTPDEFGALPGDLDEEGIFDF